MIAAPVPQRGLGSVHPVPNNPLLNLDRRLPAKVAPPADLQEIVARMALVPSRKSLGRSPTPDVPTGPTVPTVLPSNPTPVPVAKPPLLVKT